MLNPRKLVLARVKQTKQKPNAQQKLRQTYVFGPVESRRRTKLVTPGTSGGFLAVPRKLYALPLWRDDGAAKTVFLDLCFLANFADGEVEFNGRRHQLARGCDKPHAAFGWQRPFSRRNPPLYCEVRGGGDDFMAEEKNGSPTVESRKPHSKAHSGNSVYNQ